MKKNNLSLLLLSTAIFFIVFCLSNAKIGYAKSVNVISLEGGQLIENRTLVPLRSIFEELGAIVKWDQETQSVTATKEGKEVWLKIGSKTTKINGKNVTIDVAAQVRNGKTLIPLRFVSEALGANVKWDDDLQRATIIQDNKHIIVTIERKVWVRNPSSQLVENASGKRVELPNLIEATITEIKNHDIIDDWYIVKFKYKNQSYFMDLLASYELNWHFYFEDPFKKYNWSKETWDLIKNEKIKIGMTPDMVRMSWGTPWDINRSAGSWGTSEQWIYGKDISFRSYLYFDNGILTSWQN